MECPGLAVGEFVELGGSEIEEGSKCAWGCQMRHIPCSGPHDGRRLRGVNQGERLLGESGLERLVLLEKCGERGGGGASFFVEGKEDATQERGEPSGAAAEGLLSASGEMIGEPGAGDEGFGEAAE